MSSWTLAEARAALSELRARKTVVPLAAALCAAVLFAWLERRGASGFALERALHGPVFGLLLPLGCFMLTRGALGSGVDRSLGAVRFGVNRRALLLGRIAGLLLAETLFAWVLCAAVVVTVGLPWGVLATARLFAIAATAAVAHGSLLILGVSLLRFGAGLALFLDWLLGNGVGVLAMFWPRAHVRTMLGGDGPLGLGTAGSWALAVGMALSYLAVATLRTKP